jgi:murein DD-endopeptidase MepM/ murein hydrolase activator NlpD
MPIVPKPENFSVMPQVSSGGGFRNPMSEGMATLPGQRIEAMGNAMQTSAAEIARIYARLEDEANTTRVQEAQTKTMGVINGLTTTPDGKGYADQLGENALPAGGRTLSQAYGEMYDRRVADIAKSLGNDAQRDVFDAWATGRRTELMAKIDAHSAGQRRTYEDGVDDAAAAEGDNTIVTQFNDPNAVAAGLDAIAGALGRKYARAGLPPELMQADTRKLQSAALTRVVDNLINTHRLKDAEAFRTNHADRFTGDDRDAVDARLKTEADIGLMQGAVAGASGDMLKRNSGKGGPGKPGYMTEAEFIHRSIEGLGKDAAPSLVEQVTSMAGRQYNMLTKSIQDSRHHAVSAALAGLENNGGSFYDLAPNVRAAIPDDEVEAVKAHADQVTNGPVETDPVVYQQLSDDKILASLSDPAFERIGLQSLSPADRGVFAARRAELRDPGKVDIGPRSIDRESLDGALDARLQQLGISLNPPEDDRDAAAQAGTIRKTFTDNLLRQQLIAKRQFDTGGIIKTVDELFLKTRAFQSNPLRSPSAHEQGLAFAGGSGARPGAAHLRLDPLPTDQEQASAGATDNKASTTVERINAKNAEMAKLFSTITTFPLKDGPYPLNYKDLNKEKEGFPTFGRIRNHGTKAHQGLDIKAPLGTPVLAAGDGKIIFSGWINDLGYVLEIDHGNHIYSVYAHLEKGSLLDNGQHIKAGDPIARVGKTGNAADPGIDAHLHFGLMKVPTIRKGLTGMIDPMPYLYPLHWRYNGDPDH